MLNGSISVWVVVVVAMCDMYLPLLSIILFFHFFGLKEECPALTAMSSSPSLDGGPDILVPVQTDVCCSDFRQLNLPSFKPTFLFLVRLPLDIIHECIRLRVEQRPKKEPSIHSVRQVSDQFLLEGEGVQFTVMLVTFTLPEVSCSIVESSCKPD